MCGLWCKSGVVGSDSQGQKVGLLSGWLLWGAWLGGLTCGLCCSAFVSLVFCSTTFTWVVFCSELSNCHGAHTQVRRRSTSALHAHACARALHVHNCVGVHCALRFPLHCMCADML